VAGDIVRTMKRASQFFGGAVFSLALVASSAGLASASAKPTIRDGYYSSHGYGPENFFVGLDVAGHGRVVTGGHEGVGIQCVVSPTLAAADPTDFPAGSVVTIHLTRNLSVSAGGTFTFSGDVSLIPENSNTVIPSTTTLTLTGHLRPVVVPKKQTVLTGRFSAPGICAPGTPGSYADEWFSYTPNL
jgi:hypothetical protein